jgi:hypothetical protein
MKGRPLQWSVLGSWEMSPPHVSMVNGFLQFRGLINATYYGGFAMIQSPIPSGRALSLEKREEFGFASASMVKGTCAS